MPGFEKYHPVLTNHTRLDWLTTSSIKDVHELLVSDNIKTTQYENLHPENILATVNLVSGIMREIMNDNQLTWGISDHHKNLVGIISILDVNNPESIGTISFIINHPEFIEEVLDRVIDFSKNHFSLTKLNLSIKANSDIAHLLESIGFNQIQNNLWQISVSDFTYPEINF